MKNFIPLVVVLVAACLLPGCATSRLPPGIVDRITAVLPAGWDVEVQEGELRIGRKEPVHALLIFPSMSVMEKAEPTSYWFTLTQVDYLSPVQRLALEQRYAKLRKEAELLYQNAMINQIPHEIDKAPPCDFEYHPRTEEESRIVRRYKGLYAEIKQLPDLYLNGNSFIFHQFMYEFDEESEEQECQAVLNNVLSIFNEYEAESDNDLDVTPQ